MSATSNVKESMGLVLNSDHDPSVECRASKRVRCMDSQPCTVAIAGSGFMADAYDLFVINLALKCLEQDYEQSSLDKSLIASAALWGAMVRT